MKLIFALAVLVLGLGDIVPLLPLHFDSVASNSELLTETSFLGTALFVFTILGGLILLRIEKHWNVFAFCFCLAEVIVWWWWSGIFVVDVSIIKFLELKLNQIQIMLHHPSEKIVFIAIHREIVVGVFYHLALLGFLFVVIKNWVNKLKTEE